MRALLRKIRQLLKDKRFRRIWYRGVSTIAAIVVFVTTYALVLPAITMESQADCGVEAHQHDDSCYEEVLICGMEESEGHHHSDACYTVTQELACDKEEHAHAESCYDADGNLICSLEEHTHNDGCYQEKRELTCGLEETEGHTHTAECYDKVLVCGKEAHIHSTECYREDSTAVAVSTSSASTENNSDEADLTGAESADGDGTQAGTADTASAAASTAADGTDASTTAMTTDVLPDSRESESLSDGYVPTLETINFNTILNNHTGFYYFHAEEGQDIPADSAAITDWKKVNDKTELASTDLVKAYFAYSIPAGSLNETNQIARYRLPSNLHLTDDQIIAINENVNGIASGYVEPGTGHIHDEDYDNYRKYLGAEAVEGTRTPDQTLVEGTQEYISAVVKAENVFENTLDENGNYIDANGNIAPDQGRYLGQDLIFIFTPYTIEKNQNEYDTAGKPVKAGEKITGWFACDFNTAQVEWEKSEEGAQTAEVVFAEKDKEAGIKEISEKLTLLDQDDAEETVENAAESSTEDTAAATTGDDQDADKEAGNSSTDEMEEAADANETAEAAIEEAKESEEQYKSGTLKASGGDYTITLEYTADACIPENAKLKVAEITAESDPEAYEACLEQARASVSEKDTDNKTTVDETESRFFDIEIVVIDENGETGKIEPKAAVSVNIQLEKPAEKAKDAESKSDASADPAVLHFAEDGVEKIENVDSRENSKNTATDIQFEAESFSIYGVVYTVDFQLVNEGKTYNYSIPGGGALSLTELVRALDMVSDESAAAEFVSHVTDVSFSSLERVWVGQADSDTTVGEIVDNEGLNPQYSSDITEEEISRMDAQTVQAGDWVLISLLPFSTEETLTVTTDEHVRYIIQVTDEAVSPAQMEPNTGYLIYTTDSEGKYYLLKTDGTTQRYDDSSGFDVLGNDYLWTFTYVYVDDNGVERYNIRPIGNQGSSLALNNAGQSLVLAGPNNITVVPDEEHGGYVLGGYNDTKLAIRDTDEVTKEFYSITDATESSSNIARVQFYRQNTPDQLQFHVTVDTEDLTKGTVSGTDTAGMPFSGHGNYTTVTNADRRNQYEISAAPSSDRYVFHHWELNGETLYKLDADGRVVTDNKGDPVLLGSVINAGNLAIPYYNSVLTACFAINPNYNLSDDEKTGKTYTEAQKAALAAWIAELKNQKGPLSDCDKTAEVYDYENRIYRVDLTAKSNFKTFDGVVDLAFVLDNSGSMQFPSKLEKYNGNNAGTFANYPVYNLNNGHQNDLNHNTDYYIIADKTGTATVYLLWYGTYSVSTWYGSYNRTGWWAVDSSYGKNDSRRFYIETGTTFASDSTNMSYQIYVDGDNGLKRAHYLETSVNNAITDLKTILKSFEVDADETRDPDVRVAYNTYYSEVDKHVDFQNVSENDIRVALATNGGTSTDDALNDARTFSWNPNRTPKYAVLITDGAPQRHGRAIDSQDVKNAADALKAGKDNVLGTADDVTLITVGLSMGDVKRGAVLLYDLADRDSGNEKMFFSAESGDELEYVLYEIIQKIATDATVQGNITDTVGDAFYPVDETGAPLSAGDKILLDGTRAPEDYTGTAFGTIGTDDNGRFTVTWNTQNIPAANGWHGSMLVKAKEDLLGGNAVPTNYGNASVEAVSYTTPSTTTPIRLKTQEAIQQEDANKPANERRTNYKTRVDDLATPLVNVNELQFSNSETEWTVYLGTEVEPEEQLKRQYREIWVDQVITAGEDKYKQEENHPVTGEDNLKDTISGSATLYPVVKNSVSDGREGAITGAAAHFTMNDLLKTLVEGKNYTWWDYAKGEPNYTEFFKQAASATGIVLDYDVYGLNDYQHHVKGSDNPVADNSKITIKLTPTIADGEYVDTSDPLKNLPKHATKVTGSPVETYTLSVLYEPDYDIVSEGQGGSSVDDFHVGSYGTCYQGHAAGTEESVNTHIINVYAKPLEVRKVDSEGNTLSGASFALYREAVEGDKNIVHPADNNSLLQSHGLTSENGYVLVDSGDGGVVRLADRPTGSTAAECLVPGVDYFLVETQAPENYLPYEGYKTVTVEAQTDGVYTGLDGLPLHTDDDDIAGSFVIDVSDYTRPYSWAQGWRIKVDGKAEAVPDNAGATTQDKWVMESNEYAQVGAQVVFQTEVVNVKNDTTVKVTKKWVDEKGDNKAQAGDWVSFQLMQDGSPVAINQNGNSIRMEVAAGSIMLSDDGTTVTLYYDSASETWPTAVITGLPRTHEGAEYNYTVTETDVRTIDGKARVDISKASIENATDENDSDIDEFTIVNIEKRETEIQVQKKWYASDGETELSTAPESDITFEIYRKVNIPCMHNWVKVEGSGTEYQPGTEAYCEKGASYTEKCSKCNEERTVTEPAPGHLWGGWVVIKEPTAAEAGYETRACQRCGKVDTHILERLPHAHDFSAYRYLEGDAEPTCTDGGYAHMACSICGDIDEAAGQVEVPALGHVWDSGRVTQEPTCEEAGARTHTCDRCGETKTEEIPATGHDWVYADTVAATCTTDGVRHYECRNDSSHHYEGADGNNNVTIPALGHIYPEDIESNYTTLVEPTETTDGLKVLYCLRGCGHYEKTMVIRKLGETFGDTGIPVSPYEWPTQLPAGVTDQNQTTTVNATKGIIKYNDNYYVIYASKTVSYAQLIQGPESGEFQNHNVVKLTGAIKTPADINNGTLRIRQGDLYKTEDGEYWVWISAGDTANNMNGNGWKSETSNWYKLADAPSSGSNNNNSAPTANTNSLSRNALVFGGTKAGGASSAPDMSLRSAKSLLRVALTGASGDGAKGAEADAARMARIIKWFYGGDTTANVKFRSEWEPDKEESGLDVWEFVQEKTTTSGDTNGDWQWALSNLPAYDDDGNMYTYYVIETAPTETAYDISYGNNGVTEESGDKTININNTQKVGAVEVTKSFSGIDALPAGFKITATYTANGTAHTEELTTSTTGMTGSGTAADPYKWTISNLPIGTEVTFTESGYEATDYTVAVTGNGGTAAAANPAGTHSITNIYQRNVKVDIGILKIEKDTSNTIPNAGFTLWEINEAILPSGETSLKDEGNPRTASTGQGGTAAFSQLTPGYYILRETAIPKGYVVTGSDTTYFRVNSDGTVDQLVIIDGTGEYEGNKVWKSQSTSGNFVLENTTFTISNTPGAALPNTGGPGTRIFTILGSILILGAGALLWRRRRFI